MARRYYTQQANYLLCRSLGHAWDVVDADRVPKQGGMPVWLRCERCGTERHDAVSATTGELFGRGYVYDSNYRHAFDTQFADAAPTKSDYRRMLLAERLIQARAERALAQEVADDARE
jgi:hypothetical protein